MTKEEIESITRIWSEATDASGVAVTRQWSSERRDALVALALRAIDSDAERDRKLGAAVREAVGRYPEYVIAAWASNSRSRGDEVLPALLDNIARALREESRP